MPEVRICKVIKVGNSLAVVLPREILRALNIERGDLMTFGVYSQDVLCLAKIPPQTLRDLKPKQI